MAKVFEEEFMEIQSQMISLCMELVENKAVKVYAYGSIEKHSISFNAFFEMDSGLQTINNIVSNTDTIWRFLDLGISDLEKIKELCKRYGNVIPTELKMIYDCKTGKFNAKYKYESICSSQTGIDSSEVFMDWYNEIGKTV